MGEVVTMGQYTDWVARIFSDMDELMQLCHKVQEADKCEECPLKKCIYYDSMSDVFEDCTIAQFESFIAFADAADITDEDIMANYANDARQDDAVYG